MAAAACFASPFMPAVAAALTLDDKFGAAWTTWEPETLRAAVKKACGEPPAPLWTALQAAKTVRSNPERIETDLVGFAAVMIGLNNREPDFENLQICSPDEILYGVWNAERLLQRKLRPASEVLAYVQACFREAGLYAYPRYLEAWEPTADREVRQRIRAQAAAEQAKGLNVQTSVDLEAVQAAKLRDVERVFRERADLWRRDGAATE